jgi:hypothetical protein
MCVSYCLQNITVGLGASRDPSATNDTEINTPIAQDPKAHDCNGEHSGIQQRSMPWIPVVHVGQSKRSLAIASIVRVTIHMDAEVLAWPATNRPQKWTKGSMQVDVPWSIYSFLQTVHCCLLRSVWVEENVFIMQDGLGEFGSHCCGWGRVHSAGPHPVWEFHSDPFWGSQPVGNVKIL